MNPKFAISQLTLFVALFLLVNLGLYIPEYYNIRFESQVCQQAAEEDFSVQNLTRDTDYYRDLCISPLSGWQDALEPPLSFRFHLVPLIISAVITAVYSYYLMLSYSFQGRNNDDWG
jgi:hypothetical protein